MLAKSLHELEENGLVHRTEFMEVPIRVEYEITEKAKELKPNLFNYFGAHGKSMVGWWKMGGFCR